MKWSRCLQEVIVKDIHLYKVIDIVCWVREENIDVINHPQITTFN